MRRAGMEMGFLSALNGPLLAELESSRSICWAGMSYATGALTTVAASYRQIEPLIVRPVASCRNSSGRRRGSVFSSRHTYQGPIDWIDDPSAC